MPHESGGWQDPSTDLENVNEAYRIATAERDQWIKLWNRLEAAISHHKKGKLYGVDTSDEVDEALWAARDKILKAASSPTAEPTDTNIRESDEIDFRLGFALLVEALLPYWQRQESMPPAQAIRQLIDERDLYHSVLSDMADGVDAMEPYGAWAARVIGVGGSTT